MLFARLLKDSIQKGQLIIIDAHGRRHELGIGLPRVVMKLHDAALHRKLAFNAQLSLGESYMDGTMTLEEGSVADLMQVLASNLGPGHRPKIYSLLNAYRRLSRGISQYNPIGRARENVAHHYDLPDALYDSFLDVDRQYSCAYFAEPGDSLETAQARKKRHIAAKLLLKPNMRVLDIGSGWGGFGLYLARTLDADVTGITLSTEQCTYANARAKAEGLADRARFVLMDYRHVTDTFDRIVSVGMFEHVGTIHYREFFRQIYRLLAQDGVALLHAIGRLDGPGATNPWVRKYIFPGGYNPALSEVLPAIEKERLYVTDIETLRLHYAETIKAWRERFAKARDDMAQLHDERFCRMWEFYLAASEMIFRYRAFVVFQIQLVKQMGAVPMTRDYMLEVERTLPLDESPRS